ncbi:hypothetical protein [Celeribacter naphthalenivorans]|uniref:hypothetical protein n=1 Tax=Celeribacter naphthalenivorans TaxID=1614694 RepID=UPI001CFB8C6E|nr:hypothetical protein [Celeribacter naphthalenivorans]
MEYNATETDFLTLVGHFDVNVAMSDDVPIYIRSLSEEEYARLKERYKYNLQHKLLGVTDFRRATACTARDEQSARRFFEDVYKYAFEGGEEPDVTDYWDRPKPADW